MVDRYDGTGGGGAGRPRERRDSPGGERIESTGRRTGRAEAGQVDLNCMLGLLLIVGGAAMNCTTWIDTCRHRLQCQTESIKTVGN